MTQVYLVPGFLGFTELGSFSYFHRVSEVLRQDLLDRGVDAEIIEVDTLPTGSIRRRAERLLETVTERGGLRQDRLHFIGHSTGGLDIRMLLTPAVQLLPTGEDLDISGRTRSAISLSTPHHGTPLANFFTSMNGRNMLYLLALLAGSTPGRYSLWVGSKLLSAAADLDKWIGQEENILDAVAENVLKNLTPDKEDPLWEFVREISQDQGAMVQLTPEAMDLFQAAVPDPENVRCVSFVNASPPPGLHSLVVQPRNIYQSATHVLYAASYLITSRAPPNYPYPEPSAADREAMQAELPFPLDQRTSDGIVPVLSQVWGRLGGVALGDHLDVVGQFQHQDDGKTYSAWLCSGSGFDEERFQRLWSRVADVITEANGPA
jgi:triacylglycerol lipase